MPRLHLKRTPEEEALRQQRKKEKKEGKHKRRWSHLYDESEPGSSTSSRKRSRRAEEPTERERKWASSDEDEEYGPQPAPPDTSSRHRRENSPRGGEDEMGFREKLFDAFADDERLDSIEARMNDFGHVPGRWRTSSTKSPMNVFENDDWLKVDPRQLDDEDYAEWIRMGMYRKTHANEYAEQQRQKAAHAAQRAEEKARKEESARLEKAAEEERKRKKVERGARRWDYARNRYDEEWRKFLSGNEGAGTPELFGFGDIPWPIFIAHQEQSHRTEISAVLDGLTMEAISAFLLPEGLERNRKEVLRETMLRFHPDKFEGRYIKYVRSRDIESVRDGIGRVVRVLNRLMDG